MPRARYGWIKNLVDRNIPSLAEFESKLAREGHERAQRALMQQQYRAHTNNDGRKRTGTLTVSHLYFFLTVELEKFKIKT